MPDGVRPHPGGRSANHGLAWIGVAAVCAKLDVTAPPQTRTPTAPRTERAAGFKHQATSITANATMREKHEQRY